MASGQRIEAGKRRGTGSRAELESIGYTVLSGVLDRGEIADLRRCGLDYLRRGGESIGLGRYEGALVSRADWTARMVCNPRLIEAFRSLLGDRPMVFTGSADMHLNMLNIWHRDCFGPGERAWTGNFYGEGFRVYRAGIYLQDNDAQGTGFHVLRGSHRGVECDGLPVDYLTTRAGDLILIDSRVLHAGVLPDPFERVLRGAARRLGTTVPFQGMKNLVWRAKGRGERLSMFVAYGLRNPGTEEFCRFDLRLRRSRAGAAHCLSTPALLAALEQAGVISYETELHRHFGDGALRDFAARGVLPEERLWS